MRIGKLASLTGVSCDALRLYERRGMIQSERLSNGYRDYHENTVALVGMIKLGQSIGFRLSEMAPEMHAIAKHGMGAEKVAEMLRAKLVEVDARIEKLTWNRNELAHLLDDICPINAPTK